MRGGTRDRRAGARPDRAVGPPADLVRASTSASSPTFYNQLPGQHGTRYADLTQRVPFAFGEGLSYTTVEYADLQVLEPVLGADDTVRAHVTLHNTGDRPVAGDRAGLRPRHRHVGDLGRARSSRRTGRWTSRPASGVVVDLDAARRGLHARRRERPPDRRARRSSSCWSARRRATRCCCGRASSSGTDPWASTPPARRTTPSRRTTRASSPGLDAEGPLDRAMLADFADRVDGTGRGRRLRDGPADRVPGRAGHRRGRHRPVARA